MLKRISQVLILCTIAAAPAVAETPKVDLDENIFVMGGPFATGYFGDTFLFWQDHYESNFFVGAGYQRFLYGYGSFQLGVEAGLGLRLGSRSSAEIWGGAVARLTEFSFGDITVTPAITFGLSAVTDTIGIETERADRLGRGVPILYYLAPEVSVSHASHPEWEAFGRIQHRSGGFGTIADIDGSNAAVLGLRYKF
ncbi:hypothetical protein [Devosia chinhatensis]|uniref:hypothetical protein n=1 Tax=Devosia chinhatensis TaxID=429727 RepID=UPI0006989953|nr:hypothetical protein [Devosia chinhatensis]